jgi:hypothetical protein
MNGCAAVDAADMGLILPKFGACVRAGGWSTDTVLRNPDGHPPGNHIRTGNQPGNLLGQKRWYYSRFAALDRQYLRGLRIRFLPYKEEVGGSSPSPPIVGISRLQQGI